LSNRMTELDENSGPGAAFQVFLQNEALMEKLKLLNFERDFLQKQKGLRTISRITFSMPNKESHGEQFTQFIKLAQFLLQCNGLNVEVDEFDDPGTTISSISESCRRVGVNMDFPASKLRDGYGIFVVNLLNSLADSALGNRNHKWRLPSYPQEEDEIEAAEAEDDEEMMLDEEEVDEVDSDDDGAILQLDDLDQRNYQPEKVPQVSTIPSIDPEAWKEEVERLAPQLKLTLRGDQKNWRQRIDALRQSNEQIVSISEETLKKLNRIADDIGKDLDKTKSRERHINQNMENLVTELRTAHDKLAQAKETYQGQTSGIAQKSEELQQVVQELELIKTELEERGQAISDSKPLSLAKKAMADLQKDNCELDIQIATIEHELNGLRLAAVH